MEPGVWKRELLETSGLFCAQGSLYTDCGAIPCAAGASSPAASRVSHVPGHGTTAAPSRMGTALWEHISSLKSPLCQGSALCQQRPHGAALGWGQQQGASVAGQGPRQHSQHTRSAPGHGQNLSASQNPLRSSVSQRVVSGLLKQSHCG